MSRSSLMQSYLETPMGRMLALAEDRGLVLLEFTDRPALPRELAELQQRYGYRISHGPHPHIAQAQLELRKYFSGDLQRFDVPLHLPAQPFDLQVWQQLLSVPYGETRSYGELAAALGKPGACRAVGAATWCLKPGKRKAMSA